MSDQKPNVAYLVLDDFIEGITDGIYGDLWSKIDARFTTSKIKTRAQAKDFLSSDSALPRRAIIVADGAVADNKQWKEVLEDLVQFTKRGGLVIFGCNFSSFVRPNSFNSMFQKTFELSWTTGDYCRRTYQISQDAKLLLESEWNCSLRLSKEYSMKAVSIRNVPKSQHLYTSQENSSESPIIFTKYGGGFIGYIGDVNNEEGSEAVLLAFLGGYFLNLKGRLLLIPSLIRRNFDRLIDKP